MLIEFWYDYSSPYAYLLSEKIDDVAKKYDQEVVWRPFLLGVVFKELGTLSLIQQPGQARYAPNDLARSARFMGLDFRMPDPFPVSTVKAARATYALQALNPQSARTFAHRVFRAYFVDNKDITSEAVLQTLAQGLLDSPEELSKLIQQAAIKEKLMRASAEALEKGIFGAPWVQIDDEAFWGADRLPQIERWLEHGGF